MMAELPPTPPPRRLEQPISILLVDDDPKNLLVLETILNSPDYRLVQAASADEALMALMLDDFAAIVLDVQMPDMSGIELARLIKQRKKTQHVPILFLTAYYQEDEQIVLGYGAGAVDFITKPVNPAVLRSKIDVFIDLFRKTHALAEVNRAMQAEIVERQKAEERFRMVVETAPNAMVMLAKAGGIVLVNSRTETLFGYARSELIGESVQRLVPEGFPRLSGEPGDCETSADGPCERIGRHKNGSEVPIEMGLSRFASPDGSFVLASFADITERKRAEAALRAANAELAAKNEELLRQADDRARRIRAEAAKAEAEAARERSALLAETSNVLAASFDRAEIFTALARVLVPRLADCLIVDVAEEDGALQPIVIVHREAETEGQIQKYRADFPMRLDEPSAVSMTLKGGVPLVCTDFGPAEIAAFARTPAEAEALRPLGIRSYLVLPLQARGRTLGGMCLASTTARRFGDADLPFAEELAQRAALALDNSRLYDEARVARATAEAANAAKDRFLAMLSHELRTPLSPVLHAVALLVEEDACPVSMRGTLETIRRNVQLEARLIDDLLDLARIRNGKLQLHLESADAHDLLRRAAEICQPEIEAREQRLTLDLRAESTALHADPARIQQIFWNLLNNAIKFTPPAGRITLRTWNENDTLRVEVADSGIGIAAERLDKVFDAFEQAHGALSSGLGLGLAICRALTSLHGGSIEARSGGIGQGATFAVTLPVSRELLNWTKAPAADAQTMAAGTRVLLVEDHADTAETLERLLTRRGYAVATAASLRAAAECLAEGEFDVLVSDIGLPDGSGLELMPQFLAAAEGRPIAGIALSGFGMPEDVERSQRAGFHEHLTKPVDFALLQKALARVAPSVPAPV